MIYKRDKELQQRIGASTLEYIALITLILAALFIFRGYLTQSLAGRWKAVGDTFGFGRQYDPGPFGVNGLGGGTLACSFDLRINEWVDQRKVDRDCDCTLPLEDIALYQTRCITCLRNSRDPLCGSNMAN